MKLRIFCVAIFVALVTQCATESIIINNSITGLEGLVQESVQELVQESV